MGLINGGSVLELVRAYRLCWLTGKFSGGKTSFAHYMAKTFLDEGYRYVTNNASIWADDLREVQLFPADDDRHAHHLRAYVVVDEGGLYLKSGKQVEQIAAYAAKMDCIYVIPSFFPPAKDFQVLTIQPLFSFQSTGIPLIVYKWTVRLGGFRDGGWFAWFYPQEIYGTYSRQDPGADPEFIVRFLVTRTGEFREAMGRRSEEWGDAFSALETDVSESDLLRDVARSFEETAHSIEAVSARGAKSRRK